MAEPTWSPDRIRDFLNAPGMDHATGYHAMLRDLLVAYDGLKARVEEKSNG